MRSLAPRFPRHGAVAAGGQGKALFISDPGYLPSCFFQGTDQRLNRVLVEKDFRRASDTLIGPR
jgi:hypothetical protein